MLLCEEQPVFVASTVLAGDPSSADVSYEVFVASTVLEGTGW